MSSRQEPGVSHNLWVMLFTSEVNATYWLAPPDILSLFSYTPQDQLPKGGTTLRELCPPTSMLIEKMPFRHAYRPVSWKYFLSWCSYFSADSSLCEVAKILATKKWSFVNLNTNTSLFNCNLSFLIYPKDVILILITHYKTFWLLVASLAFNGWANSSAHSPTFKIPQSLKFLTT